jgi:hypothetical protein
MVRSNPSRALLALLPRLPVPLLGLLLVSYSLLTACVGMVDGATDTDVGVEPPRVTADAGVGDAGDAPSEDTDADRADGMSYGDAYGDLDGGGPDAHVEDAHVEDAHAEDAHFDDAPDEDAGTED